MTPYYDADGVTLYRGDALAVLREMPDASVHAVVTDPPYGLAFMGKRWDYDVPSAEVWAEVLRVLKPGGHLLSFGGTRTYHRMVVNIEDAGFEIRDQLAWLFGSGFPKSLDVSKAIDKRKDWGALQLLQTKVRAARLALGISQSEAARRIGLIGENETLGGGGFMWFETGQRIPTQEQYQALKAALALDDQCDAAFEAAEREMLGEREFGDSAIWGSASGVQVLSRAKNAVSRAWEGWGTALKPAHEPIVLARKPLDGTVAANVLKHGCGALNIDDCRIGTSRPPTTAKDFAAWRRAEGRTDRQVANADTDTDKGRWPANVLLDEEAAAVLDAQSGELTSGAAPPSGFVRSSDKHRNTYHAFAGNREEPTTLYGDTGGASRFFYVAKASRSERNAGLEGLPDSTARNYAGAPLNRSEHTSSDGVQRTGHRAPRQNTHPTVKPVALMRWLVRLVAPPRGIVLDPFMGSGSTGVAAVAEGFGFVGIEREAEYIEIARRRIANAPLPLPLEVA